jgi:tripartite-type tricarboxylate transporter receptor subunit TctC
MVVRKILRSPNSSAGLGLQPRYRAFSRVTMTEDLMRLSRRVFVRGLGGAIAMPVIPGMARAEAYPARPVKLVVGFAPGSGPDMIARLTADWLSKKLGQPFVVEDRQGAGSNIATETVIRAPSDGYTLLHATVANTINAKLNDRADFTRDTTPVAAIARASFFLVVQSSFPARTVPDLITYAKANPGKLTMGSSGSGSAPYLAGELFKIMSGTEIVHVPYTGTPQAITELLGGRVSLVVADPSAIEVIKAGKLRALAATAAATQDILPDVPPLGKFLPGYEASTWHGISGPKNLPSDIVALLNRAINDGLADKGMKARLAQVGFALMGGSPLEFGKLINDEAHKWSDLVRRENISLH